MGRLQGVLGIALKQLGREDEGLAALSAALAIALKASMPLLEANVRGNLADSWLRRHDYARAEQEARLALKAAQAVKEENMVVMARANLGFALMGQGRMAEGSPYIDSLIEDMRKSGALPDLIALLDEKGRMQERAAQYREALLTVREQQAAQLGEARAARDRAVAAVQEQYQASQRTRQIDTLRRENQLQEADLRHRRALQLVTTFAAVLTVLASAVVWVMYRRAARSNAQLHTLNTQLEFHSMRDALTGLHNRRAFLQKMTQRAQRSESERRADDPGSVDCIVLMHIDHFKSINDRWGHGVGDAVLVEVARRLVAAVRESDMVLRWGGEEFMIHAPGADPAHVGAMLARVLDGIGGSAVDAGTCSVPVTLSAGVVMLPLAGAEPAGFDWERAIRLADWALYQGKANGRNHARIVTRLCAPLETVLAAIDSAKDAPAAGLAAVDVVHGPRRQAREPGDTAGALV